MNNSYSANMMSGNALLSRGVLKHLDLFDSDEEGSPLIWQTDRKKSTPTERVKEDTRAVETSIIKSKKNSKSRGYFSKECRMPSSNSSKRKDQDTPVTRFYPSTERRMHHSRRECGYSPCIDFETSYYNAQEYKAMRDNVKTEDMCLKEKSESPYGNESKSTELPVIRNLMKDFEADNA